VPAVGGNFGALDLHSQIECKTSRPRSLVAMSMYNGGAKRCLDKKKTGFLAPGAYEGKSA
jgi:hypothetical protein